MSDTDILQNIMYVAIPEDTERTIGEFAIDPDIMIPVEIPEGNEAWTMQNLSWELIVASMLKVLVHDAGHQHADYYRNFVVAAKPSIYDDLMKNGVEQAEQKNLEVAEEIFRAASAVDPNQPLAWINLALAYEEHANIYEKANRADLSEQHREQTFELYASMIKAFPGDSRVLFNAGHFFISVRSYDRARIHLISFLDISTDEKKNELVREILAELERQTASDELFSEAYDFIKLGKERQGIEKIEHFLVDKPDVWNAWFILGWAHRRLEEYESGKNAFLRAIELGSNEADTYNELAICQMELEEYDASASTLQQALRLESENVKIISNFGILEIKRGRLEAAEGFFRTVLEITPDDAIAQSYLDYLTRQDS